MLRQTATQDGPPFKAAWLKTISLIILGVMVMLPRVLPFPPLYIVIDEIPISRWTSQMAQALLAGDWEKTANNAYPAITLAWLELPQLQIIRLFSGDSAVMETVAEEDDAFFAALPRRRFGLALMNSMAVLVAFWLLRQLYNDFIAVTATILMALDPFLLTQARAFRTEGLVTSFMLLSVLTLLLYLQKRRNRWLVTSAIMAGLASLTKITAVYLFPFTALAVVGWALLSGRPGCWLKRAGALAGWGLVAGITFVIFWPALWTSSAQVFGLIYDYLQRVGGDSSAVWRNGVLFFQGRLIAEDPGVTFYLWYLAYRITPTAVVGVAALGGYGLWRLLSGPARFQPSLRSREIYLVTSLIVAYAFFYFVAMCLGASKVDRYLVPIFPALSILAAVGFQGLASSLPGPSAPGLWGVVFASSAIWALPHHPYYFSYWNPLLGGGRQAARIVPVGGLEGTDALVGYLNSLPDAHEIKLAGPGVPYCTYVFAGECLNLNDFLGSDYFITDIASIQRNVYLNDPEIAVPGDELAHTNIRAVVAEAELILQYRQGGLDYAWLYKMPAGLQNVHQALPPHGIFKGYQLATPTAGAGDRLKISLFWQNGVEGWTLKDSEFFVKLLDESGQILQVAPAQLEQEFKSQLSRPNKHVVFIAPFIIPPDTPLGVYSIEIGLRVKATGEETWHFPLTEPANTLTINRGGRHLSPQALSIQYPLQHRLGETGLTLLGYTDWSEAEQFPHLVLYWQAGTALDEEYLLSLKLVGQDGQVAAAWTRPLALPIHPLRAWQAGETVALRFPLTLGYKLPAQSYQSVISLLPAGAPADQPIDTVPLGSLAGGAALPGVAMQHQLNVTLGEYVDLLGYDLKVKQEEGSGTLFVSLYWLNRNLAASPEVEVQLLDKGHKIMGQQVQSVPAPAGSLSWHSASHYQFALIEAPARVVIKILPERRESPAQMQLAGRPVVEQVVIDDVVNKVAPVTP